MTSLSVTTAQAYCTALTKKSGSNFYYSFLFLPRKRRAAMYTVYAFCKEVDNAVDEPPAGSNPRRNCSGGEPSLKRPTAARQPSP